MANIKLTYTEAVAELEQILADLENNPDINMDLIAGKVKRAGVLMAFCKKQLHELDEELENMISGLDS
ncbi:MAG TPA: exodeoxyribonuclease VII small subunit [Paludibacter sp.]|nr:exodeoxyribonuclease VII small subunit [Paludibacter sp.]